MPGTSLSTSVTARGDLFSRVSRSITVMVLPERAGAMGRYEAVTTTSSNCRSANGSAQTPIGIRVASMAMDRIGRRENTGVREIEFSFFTISPQSVDNENND